MPFGTVFGAVLFSALALWSGARIFSAPGGPGRALDALAAVLGIVLALGLLMRQGWARWAGFAASLALAFLGLASVAVRGAVGDFVLFFGFAAAGLLLAVPATGNARRGLAEGAKPFPRAGRVLGWTSLALAVLLLAAVAMTGTPARRSGPRAAGGPAVAPSEAPAESAAPAGDVEWLDYGAALAKAKSSGKPVFVDFYATWCGYCKRMERQTFRDPDVVRLLGEVVTSKVDGEETSERAGHRGVDLAARYRVEVYPTLVLVDAEGNEIARQSGFMPTSQFLGWLRKGLRSAGSSPESGAARS